jgi:hypothetical protein
MKILRKNKQKAGSGTLWGRGEGTGVVLDIGHRGVWGHGISVA